jgi:hypothetical protein
MFKKILLLIDSSRLELIERNQHYNFSCSQACRIEIMKEKPNPHYNFSVYSRFGAIIYKVEISILADYI